MRFLAAMVFIALGVSAGMRAPALMVLCFGGAWWVMKGFAGRREDSFVAVLAVLAGLGVVASVIFH